MASKVKVYSVKNGVESQMGDTFDEPAVLAIPMEKLTGVIQTPRSIGPAI